MLDDFFWRVSLGNRYSSGVEGKIAQDINKIDQIINSSLPKYEWSIDITQQFLMHLSVWSKNAIGDQSNVVRVFPLYIPHFHCDRPAQPLPKQPV